MGAICDYDLWVLGDAARSVIPHLQEQGWSVLKESEMGVHFEKRSGYLYVNPPRFSNHPELLIVMSASHDRCGFNHFLHVAQWEHYVNREWEADEERDRELSEIESDGFDADNLSTECLYERGIGDTGQM